VRAAVPMHTKQHIPDPGPRSGDALLCVRQGADGVWTVSEDASAGSAMAYFPTKRAAVRHAVAQARLRRASEVRVPSSDGRVESTRAYVEGSHQR
jgi:hypothetical protein